MIARTIEQVVASLPPALVTGETPLGISVGVARAQHDADVMELMERADRALYAVKPGGRRAR